MIYRADFTANNLKSRLISPVIFGNITKIYFDIMKEEEAKKEIERMIKYRTLISDMVDIKQFKADFSAKKIVEKQKNRELMIKSFGKGLPKLDEKNSEKIINKIKNKDRLKNGGFNQNLREKRHEFRELKNRIKNSSIEYGSSTTRMRNSIDRFTGTTIDGHLFQHEEVKYDRNKIYSIFIYTESERVKELIELSLEIIEKVGIGTDTSIGNGVMKFRRYDGKIFTKDTSMQLNEKKQIKSFNLASTIISKETLNDYKFDSYIVKRYDSRTPKCIKPFYHYIECGSEVIMKKDLKPYIISDKKREIKTYTCAFPIIFEGDDNNV